MDKHYTVTPDGRTIVDANKLFAHQDVIDLIADLKRIDDARSATRRGASARPQSVRRDRIKRPLK